MATATIEKPMTIAPVLTSTWIALIYIPGEELDDRNTDALMTGLKPTARPAVARHFQTLAAIAPDHKPGTAISSESFAVHPGSNLGIHRRSVDDRESIERLPVTLWNQVMESRLNQRLVSMGAIVVLTPTNPDDEGEPAYRHFSDEVALQLVQFHTHESWVDRALVGETRPAIKTAAEARKQAILAIRRKLQEGQ